MAWVYNEVKRGFGPKVEYDCSATSITGKWLKRKCYKNGDITHTASDKCADKCMEKSGCRYFSVQNVFGKGSMYVNGVLTTETLSVFECNWEKTSDSSCPEGWQKGDYDFYELQGNFYHPRTCALTNML